MPYVRSAAEIAETAVRAFNELDLRSATRMFLKHARGAFGLAVCTSLAPCAVVLASLKQPMAMAVGKGFVAYASERAALHAGLVGERVEARRVLGDGEVICISIATQAETCWPGCVFRVSSASIRSEAEFRELQACDLDRVQNNRHIMTPLADVSMLGDVVGNTMPCFIICLKARTFTRRRCC